MSKTRVNVKEDQLKVHWWVCSCGVVNYAPANQSPDNQVMCDNEEFDGCGKIFKWSEVEKPES